MQGEEKLHPFDPTGLTPPKGRLGHSLPTPRIMGGDVLSTTGPTKGILNQFSGQNATKLDSWSTNSDLHHSGGSASSSGSAVSPVQFYTRRDHGFGGSLSKLERIKSLDPPMMEPFDETEEDENVFLDSSNEIDRKFIASPGREKSMEYVGGISDGGGVGGGEGGHGPSRKSSTGVGGRVNPSVTLDRLSGDSLLSFSYSTTLGGSNSLSSDSQLGSSFIRAFTQGLNSSFSVPGPYLHSTSPIPPIAGSESTFDQSTPLFPTTSRNPNKAIVTIDANTSKILVANEMTCELFGYQRSELSGMKVQRLFTKPYRGKHRALVEQNITASGETKLVSGKVMDAVTSYGVEFPVSVWMRRVGVDSSHSSPTSAASPRVIVVIEPVERSSALFSLSADHQVASCDPWFACVFGFNDSLEVIGKNVCELIPSLKVPNSLQDLPQMPSKQAVTGRTKDGTVFPLTVHYTDVSQSLSVNDLYSPTRSAHQVSSSDSADPSSTTPADKDHLHSSLSPGDGTSVAAAASKTHQSSSSMEEQSSTGCINCKVVVYAALSGMVSFFTDGTIHSCNQHFALMLFGYNQEELQKKDISLLLPDFHQQIGYVDDRNMSLPPVDEEDAIFHSAMERSLSPERAVDYLAGNCPVTSPTRKGLTSSSHGVGRSLAPLKFPDLNDYSECAKPQFKSHAQLDRPFSQPSGDSLERPASSPILPTSGGATSKSHEAPPSDQPGAAPGDSPSSGREEDVLPPVPKRLVPSKSTERIMALLTDRGLATSYDTPQSLADEGAMESPVSSTPMKKQHNPGEGVRVEADSTSVASVLSLPEGTFMGDAKHKDGSLMAVVFQLKRVCLEDGQEIYCMWLSRDLDMERARTADLSMSINRSTLDPYGPNMAVSPEVGVVGGGADMTDGAERPNLQRSTSLQQQKQAEEMLAVEGEYASNYNTLNHIGKGAFGFVKVAKKLDDGQLVVVKFLRKASVLKDCWIQDSEMGKVPLEIALLARLQHDNIIQLLEAYENEHFFQMVMEKHGEGLDLFEFIERSPRLTEQHISYIFRQMVAAIAYLHGMGIVHRDIKDENIIINQVFHIKLIDFGSAAHMGPGKKFSTFCGTLEYCSPEVLLGNSYSGPELELWAVGVTLYTLVFGENPFFDVEETIAGHLQPPFLTSPGLMKVLLWLLHPDPKSRATIPDLLLDKWTNQPVDSDLMHFSVVLNYPPGATSDGGNASAATAHAQNIAEPRRAVGKVVKSNSEGGVAMQLSMFAQMKIAAEESRRTEQ